MRQAFVLADASNVNKKYAPDVLCVRWTGFLTVAANARASQVANATCSACRARARALVVRADQRWQGQGSYRFWGAMSNPMISNEFSTSFH